MEELYKLKRKLRNQYEDFMKLHGDFKRNERLFAVFAIILIVELAILIVLVFMSSISLSIPMILLILFTLAIIGIDVRYCYEAHTHAERCKTLANKCLRDIEKIEELELLRDEMSKMRFRDEKGG